MYKEQINRERNHFGCMCTYEETGAADAQSLLFEHALLDVANGLLDAQHGETHDLRLQRHVQLHLLQLHFGRTGAPSGRSGSSSDGLPLALVAEKGGYFEPVGDEEDGQGPSAAGGQQKGAGGADVVVLVL